MMHRVVQRRPGNAKLYINTSKAGAVSVVPQTKLWTLVSVLLLSILVFLPAQTAFSSSVPLLTTSLIAGTPIQTTLQGNQAVAINYTDNINAPFAPAIVWLSVQNGIGQTVGTFWGTVTISGGQTIPAYVIISGLESGHYTGTIFVVYNGVPVSTTSTVQLIL